MKKNTYTVTLSARDHEAVLVALAVAVNEAHHDAGASWDEPDLAAAHLADAKRYKAINAALLAAKPNATPPAAVTIKTEFLSPTDRLGSRFRAWSTAPRRSITIPRDYEQTAPEAHRAAAYALAQKIGGGSAARVEVEPCPRLQRTGSTDTGYTFTYDLEPTR